MLDGPRQLHFIVSGKFEAAMRIDDLSGRFVQISAKRKDKVSLSVGASRRDQVYIAERRTADAGVAADCLCIVNDLAAAH